MSDLATGSGFQTGLFLPRDGRPVLETPVPGDIAKRVHERFLQVEQEMLSPIPPPFDKLHPVTASRVAAKWKVPCEDAFRWLANNCPPQLLLLIRKAVLEPEDLTFAAEIAGQIEDSAEVRAALVPLLSHPSAIVREGAIYGLLAHRDAVVCEAIGRLANQDDSPGVRLAAQDALES